MFDLIINDETQDREILLHILKELKTMALDLSGVTADLAALQGAVTKLITADVTAEQAAAATTAADQAQVDAMRPSIQAITAQANAALTPPAPPAPAPAA